MACGPCNICGRAVAHAVGHEDGCPEQNPANRPDYLQGWSDRHSKEVGEISADASAAYRLGWKHHQEGRVLSEFHATIIN